MWSSGHLQNYTKPKKSSIVTIWRRNVTLVKNITGNVEGKALKHLWSHWKELGNHFYGLHSYSATFLVNFLANPKTAAFTLCFRTSHFPICAAYAIRKGAKHMYLQYWDHSRKQVRRNKQKNTFINNTAIVHMCTRDILSVALTEDKQTSFLFGAETHR